MARRDRTIVRVWPAASPEAAIAVTPRADVVTEQADGGGRFTQVHGPFHHYHRTVVVNPDGAVEERTEYRLVIPWFGWLFALPVRHSIAKRRAIAELRPWWSPPDLLSARQVQTLGLLAAASMAATFANTLFTQTASFAGKGFGISDGGQSIGGAVVRLGVLIALPFAVLADRLGRRRTIVLLAWLAPVFCALGAAAPTFWFLVASQAVGRPLGIALALLIAIAATEDMPRNSRAFALSVLAMSAGLGAGVAVAALKLADLGRNGWRFVYVISLVWLLVAVSLSRHLRETKRFETVHRIAPPLDRRRLGLIALVAISANMFVAPASFFQNRYLEDVRGYSGGGIALFTLATGTPASIGLIVGGRLADVVGRRALIAICTPVSTACLAAGYFASGPAMWLAALAGGFFAGMAYPAFAVYRTEMFPTGNRGRANGLVTTSALLSGSAALLLVGYLRDRGFSFGSLIAMVAVGQLVAAYVAYRYYPETAHLELEAINPEDPAISQL